jgi:hypothetical protein
MNCHAWQDLLQQHLDGVSPPGALDRHLLDCPDCAARRLDVRRLLDGLALLHPPVPPADLADRVTDQLVAEVRARRARTWRRRVGSLVALAAAAAILLTLGLWSWGPISGGNLDRKAAPGSSQVAGPDPSSVHPPAPHLRDSVTQAGQAVAALTSRTASNTMERTTTLLPLVKGSGLDPLTEGDSAGEPKLEPLREAAGGVSAGLAPVADQARRAVNLFFRDLPMGRDERPEHDNKPG